MSEPYEVLQVQSVQARYVGRLQVGLRDWQQFEEALLARTATEEELTLFHRLSHNYAGSGATFGFPELSRTGKLLQAALEEYMKAPEMAQHVAVTQALANVIGAMCDAVYGV